MRRIVTRAANSGFWRRVRSVSVLTFPAPPLSHRANDSERPHVGAAGLDYANKRSIITKLSQLIGQKICKAELRRLRYFCGSESKYEQPQWDRRHEPPLPPPPTPPPPPPSTPPPATLLPPPLPPPPSPNSAASRPERKPARTKEERVAERKRQRKHQKRSGTKIGLEIPPLHEFEWERNNQELDNLAKDSSKRVGDAFDGIIPPLKKPRAKNGTGL